MTGSLSSSLSVALLSSSTTQFLSDSLAKELRRSGWNAQIWQAGFNQYRQEILNPASPLYTEPREVVILYLEGEDLFADLVRHPLQYTRPQAAEVARTAAADVAQLIAVLRQGLPDAVLILNTIYLPPISTLTGLEYHSAWGMNECAPIFNAELGRVAREHNGVLVLDVLSMVLDLGYRHWADSRMWLLARSRLSHQATKSLTQGLIHLLRGWRGQSRKCLVLDLDHTLWGGVVGEDGLAGIQLGESGLGLAFAEFQAELSNLSQKGILLAICSKNNEADALEVIEQHPAMRLRSGDFVARRINWQDKPANLREIAAELNLGLDSFAFIDDNPAERELVRASLPEVYVPDWPADPGEYKSALLDLATEHFARTSLTSEDQDRTALYRSRAERETLAQASNSLEGYYRSLQMRMTVDAANSSSFRRIAQLTQKTNQFNLTTRRYTETEIQDWSARGAIVWSLRLKDRFADEGIVGVLIVSETSACVWTIDTLLLSCRVIGRTVERAFLAYLCWALKARGANTLIGEYLPTKKNGLTANLYQDLGFEREGDEGAVSQWRLDLTGKAIPIPEWIAVTAEVELTHA